MRMISCILQKIDVIGLQTLQAIRRFVSRPRLVAAVDFRHQKNFFAITVTQRLAHAHFAVAIVIVPAVVHER